MGITFSYPFKPFNTKGVVMKYKVVVLLLMFPMLVYAEKIGLQWDYEGVEPDGFRIYQRVAGSQYDYSSPLPTVEFPDGNITPETRQVTIDLPGLENDVVKYEFVARSYLNDEVSENSNQVDYTVVRVPPAKAIDLSGVFNRQESVIKISWSQPSDEYSVNHWRVYYKLSSAPTSDYTELGLIVRDNPLELTTEFNIIEIGTRESVDFVVVSYRRNGTYSGNSETLTLDIDRRQLGPVQNLRINIEIPVT